MLESGIIFPEAGVVILPLAVPGCRLRVTVLIKDAVMHRTETYPLPPVGKLPALHMGLRGCAPELWLDGPDAFADERMRARQLSEKQVLLAEQSGDVFACLDDGRAAARDASQTIADHLSRYNQITTSAEQASSLARISAVIPEDILILTAPKTTESAPDWILTAASLCFPSHWRLSEKMGRSITAIHAPVPGFADTLAKQVNRFFTTMQPGRLSQRLNWSVQTGDRLFAPTRPPFEASPRFADEWGEVIFVRIERQCFYKLPVTGAVIFTIRTSLAPLNRFRQTPEFVQAVLGQADKLSSAFAVYKNIDEVETGLRVWIDKHLPCPT